MNTKYGLTPADRDQVQDRIDRQKKYLEDSTFATASGQVKTLLDVSYSANHSERYYAQLVNKINTMTDYAGFIGYVPHFLTMTLDGFWRDLLHRNDSTRFMELYREYTDLRDRRRIPEERERYCYLKNTIRKIPDNDVYGYVLTKIFNGEQLSVKDLYNVLNFQMKNFLSSASFKQMREHGVKPIYVRTVEPHKDGIPHFHAMFYFPDAHRDAVMKDFQNAFPAPRNSSPLIDNGQECPDGQMHGFVWKIDKPAAYVLKYVTKSFMDVKNQKEIDYIQAWYIKHRIIRSVTSHSVLPQWAYQKLYPLEKDWYYLTDIIKRGAAEWSREDDYIRIIDTETSRMITYERGEYTLSYGDRVVKTFGERKEEQIKPKVFDDIPTCWTNAKADLHTVEVNGIRKRYRLVKPGVLVWLDEHIPAGSMKDFELLDYFGSLDIDTVNLDHFAYVKNQLIDRGMLRDERLPIQAYSSNEYGF